jgi:hypothetical protein
VTRRANVILAGLLDMLTKIYKPGQGKHTRLWAGFTVGTIVALGSWRLYQMLGARDLSLVTITLVPVAVFVALGVLV